ncbi:hypothetical protein NC651_010851 [Populus alba x Populus x berolinensis]|nr:hypothetical protein NC651_010851 [Populus alba x Populus x berolinensis]
MNKNFPMSCYVVMVKILSTRFLLGISQ